MTSEVGNHGDREIGIRRAQARAKYDEARARRERLRADAMEGKSIDLADAQAQINGLAAAVRRQLNLAPAYLSADLQPDVREAAAKAMADAIHRALGDLTRSEIISPKAIG